MYAIVIRLEVVAAILAMVVLKPIRFGFLTEAGAGPLAALIPSRAGANLQIQEGDSEGGSS